MNAALSHMAFWIIQHIQQVKNEAESLEKDTVVSEEQKKERSIILYRTLISLLVILKPALEFAKQEYPEFANLIEWAESLLNDAVSKGNLTGSCACNSCKKSVESSAQ